MRPGGAGTLVYGGTFDPVHRGHLTLAGHLVELFGDVTINLVPCQIPPHRSSPCASPEHRLKMLELAVSGMGGVVVDACELERPGTSYTYDTLAAYRKALGPDATLVFVMGLDSWVTLPEWHRWKEFLALAHVLVLDRPGVEQEETEDLRDWARGKVVRDPQQLLDSPGGLVCHVRPEIIDVSASALREKIARGESVEDEVGVKISEYITSNGLYRD